VLLEDFQQIAFPLVVALFFLGTRYFKLGVSAWLAVVPILFWGASLTSIRGVVDYRVFGPSMAMARLVDDPDLEMRGKFYRDYQRLARQASFPALKLLENRIESSGDAQRSLEKMELDLLVSGKYSWLNLTLAEDRLEKIAGVTFSVGEVEGYENYVSSDDIERTMPLAGPYSGEKWFILKGPRSLSLPTRDSLLARSFIGWLGLALNPDIVKEPALGFSPRKTMALSRISESFGLWASNVPRAFGGFLLGTSYILNSIESELLAELKLCARSTFASAASRVSVRENPELYVAIYNNAAVAKIISTTTPHVMKLARAELWKAANARDKKGALAPGAKIAYANLIKLERLGLVIR